MVIDMQNLPKIIQEGIENPNSPISIKKVEFVTENLPQKKTPDPDGFAVDQTF